MSVAQFGVKFTVDGTSKKIQGLVPVPVGNLAGFNFADRVWLES